MNTIKIKTQLTMNIIIKYIFEIITILGSNIALLILFSILIFSIMILNILKFYKITLNLFKTSQ